MRMQVSACMRNHDHASCARMVDPETKQDKFFALMLRFETNPTSSENHSKPYFLNINSHT